MTYCVAVSVDSGLVFCSDSRTNAGPDMLSSYSKMNIFRPNENQRFCILTSGNLATTQAIIDKIQIDLEQSEVNLGSFERLTEAAEYVSNVSRTIQTTAQASAGASGVDVSASLLLGGQINGKAQNVFLIYAAGNFIAASKETLFLQIGESKYGKPILDRVIKNDTPLEDVARCALVSMDSTIKSNSTVAPPIETLIFDFASFDHDHYVKMDIKDPYLENLRIIWDQKIKEAFSSLPKFEWENLG